jgi:hypothetical protein
MVNFKDFKSSFDKHKHSVPEIHYDEITFLWIGDYYDGMLEGMLKYKNQKYKFKIITDCTQHIYPRIFAIIGLTENEMKEEEYWNEQFEKYVGNHNNVQTKEEKTVKLQSEHHLFYEAFNKRKNKGYDKNIVKGWYIEP